MTKAALNIVQFQDRDATALGRVGGKGANLGRLTQAGFDVPAGFCVTTDAYAAFLSEEGLGERLAEVVDAIDYDDAESLDEASSSVDALVREALLPAALDAEIAAAYEALGPGVRVAVRSSGTAEDLAGHSFAGLHDTILDVCGPDLVADAVKRCWASLWTARAAAYRHDNAFAGSEVRMAVVVQEMVSADVAGVLFTANPFTTATDEMVVNASWGLGEAVVSGLVTPDEYTLHSGTLGVLDHNLGTKLQRVGRDPHAPSGTVVLEVPESERSVPCLAARDLRVLGALGRRVQDHYEGIPQDIEWALADGKIYLLQARPITGVELSWDADVDDWYAIPDSPDEVWTRAYADEAQNGAVTALTYSSRYSSFLDCWQATERLFGSDALGQIRPFKFHKGEIYYSTRWERKYVEQSALPPLRALSLAWTAPDEHEEILAAPWSWARYARYLVRVMLIERHMGPFGALKRLEHWRTARAQDLAGLSSDQLRRLPDAELKAYVERQRGLERAYGLEVIPALQLQFRDALGVLGLLVQKWYTGDDPLIFAGLITGTTEPTDTQKENAALWRLSGRIRESSTLQAELEANADEEFFEALEQTDEGRAFLTEYRAWATGVAHRGSADRDMLYPTRGDDPAIDARTFRMLLSLDGSQDPERKEREADARREAAHDAVVENLRSQPAGFLKAAVFKFMFKLTHRWIAYRDNERQSPNDLVLHSIRRGFVEMGRRLHERGVLKDAEDFHHLSFQELYRVFEGHEPNLDLVHAKVAARRRDVDRMLEGERPPKLLRRNRPVVLSTPDGNGDGSLQGHPTNPGTISATARVVPRLAELGRVQPGEILITHSTDPGWTPVFLVISGIVTETGGMVSHASCLAREYGLPAIQLEDAMRLIPDGATIELDANTGLVTVIEAETEAPAESSPTVG